MGGLVEASFCCNRCPIDCGLMMQKVKSQTETLAVLERENADLAIDVARINQRNELLETVGIGASPGCEPCCRKVGVERYIKEGFVSVCRFRS